MDLISLISASDLIEVRSSRSPGALRARFAELKPRGFISDITNRSLTSREKGDMIIISRQSSLFGRLNAVTCKIKLLPHDGGTLIRARIWHPFHATLWFCLSYSLAATIGLAGVISAGHGTQDISTRIASIVGCAFGGAAWGTITAVFNGLLRAWTSSQIDPQTHLVQSCGTTEGQLT